jgi:hypothetical protein
MECQLSAWALEWEAMKQEKMALEDKELEGFVINVHGERS